MITFDYTALDRSDRGPARGSEAGPGRPYGRPSGRTYGRRIRGRARARDELELDRDLAAKRLTLLHARPASGGGARRGLCLDRVELVRLVTQLATTVGAGLPLCDGLAGIGRRMETEPGRRVVDDLRAGLEAGDSLSRAMARHPRAFPVVVVSSVEAGEATGELAGVLAEVGRHLEATANLRASAVQALLYPAILFGAVLGLVVVLLTFVLPRIVGLYPAGRDGLPAETRAVLLASDALVGHGGWLAGALLAAAAVACVGLRRPTARARLDGALLSLPRVGRLLQQLATARFASTASTLQAAGCDVFTLLRIAGDTCGNAALALVFRRAGESVRRGETLAGALERERRVDPLLVQMVGLGERTGELDACLARVSAHYAEEVPRTVKRLVAVLEPALLLCAGAVVAFILLAALLPLFDLYEAIG